MKIKKILSESKYDYDIIQHDQPILTREDGAEYLGIDISQTAPTLILKTDRGFFGLIISGSREQVDFNQLAAQLNCKKVKLASAKEVKKVTGFSVGSVALP
ncbi:YbaK/EbsC family protein [Terrilactibacillus sp. S3-3]|nr:YbaK/EbsC family protein [Terrilactibacillus sp. S3-3]